MTHRVQRYYSAAVLWLRGSCVSVGRYSLSKSVYACETSGVLIFLDLRRDQYFSLDRGTSGLLAPLLSGQPHQAEIDEGQKRTLCRTVDMLMAQGLLTAEGATAHSAFQVHLTPATTSLSRVRYSALSEIPVVWRIDFFNATVTAAYKLRWWSITRVVESVRVRRRNRPPSFDSPHAAELMSAYGALRPLFPKQYICLFDSLAALEFLARRGSWPQWVFGVKASPFGAHCWLQDGELVLNDSVEHVLAYTPIMVV